MRSVGIFQKKSLGQVFLQVRWPLERIVEQVRSWGGVRVLEIGPGGGVLTRELCAAGLQVTAVEKDERFAARLPGTLDAASVRNLKVVSGDILRFDLGEWLRQSTTPAVVVGNIPYNISSPIFAWLLPHLADMGGAMLMVQLEFAERLAARAGTKEYGSLSVFAQLRADLELAFTVEKGCFRPVPKVDSAVITMRGRSQVAADDEILRKVETVTKTAFSQRRKKMRNSIAKLLESKDIADCPIDLERRPETLTPLEYVALTRYLLP